MAKSSRVAGRLPRSRHGRDSTETTNLVNEHSHSDASGAIAAGAGLGAAVKTGFAWSFINNAVGRLGNFLTGIVIVRLLTESEFGTFAVAMVVVQVLLSANDLGVSVAVVRHKGSVKDIAPTVVTLSIVSSALLTAAAFAAAPVAARTLGAPEATWIIRLLALNVLIDGVVAVPNALITRALQQRRRLIIDTIAFFVGTPVTIILAVRGYGAWSLGWGTLIGTVTTGVLALAWAPERYWPGWRREVVPGLLRFGLPLAGSSLLLLLLLNVDYMVVGHLLGAATLGFYVLAFNICSWPISVIIASIRRVALAAFSRMHEHNEATSRTGFANVLGLVLAVSLPVCACLAIFAPSIVHVLYGEGWAEAAGPLRFLAVLAVGRILVELTYDFLAAVGRGSHTFWLHLFWLVALTPALVIGCLIGGINGAAAAHAAVVAVVALPLALYYLGRAGVTATVLARTVGRPVAGTLLILVLGTAVTQVVSSPYALIVIGSLTCLCAYAVVVWPMRKQARELWAL